MPISATWMRGTDVDRRALPSFVCTTRVPVSATPKLTPVMPASAARNRSRSASRA